MRSAGSPCVGCCSPGWTASSTSNLRGWGEKLTPHVLRHFCASRGYRLNIEPVGSRALHDCLPPHLWEILVATAGDPGPGMGVLTERLRLLMRGGTPHPCSRASGAASRS
ncbi:hypothetical protein OG369_42460 [Streptomyces sp. NBC_01221]|uniref:hypothetical protein n=1 Tax=unclassified Streptomyces TaxID=2593676 RepID=UPI00224FB798|nr:MULTISPECIES: hypothetical protein [unclassified Streptomyces]MCX4792442.1 hypothetical protein [Streptomyces sp. NBC_01221]MCX4799789.1 hypothetical protein [Streptomyces sp. NBC_01242]WSU26867.1 hypothetical protein OG508_39485 [Streptomyces sp. NBC_01108]